VGATLLPLRDAARGRALPTSVYAPAAGTVAPLIVFCHGMWGHPRKFTWLFSQWADAGYVVAAPAFPHSTDENPSAYLAEDVVNQPADVSFVLDELLARGLGDAARVGVGGFSLGAETALAVGLHPRFADARVRAVVALVGALFHPDFAADVLRPLPLLLVYGTADKERRIRESLQVFEAAQEPKELVTIEGARHGICQDDDPRPYVERVAELTTAFWHRYLRR
jgi:predicted dienelactone hydrolase